MPKILANKALLRKAEAYALPAIVVLVGLSAFGLGRLSALQDGAPRLVIHNALVAAPLAAVGEPAAAAAMLQASGKYVASKSGTKYYLSSCGAAARIKEENKVWFESVADAAAAGYGPAANCPGL